MEKFCAACGQEGKPKKVTKGHFLMEVFLWILFIVPGLIYTVWRHASRHYACRACGSQQLLPLDSPMARQMRAQLAQQPRSGTTVS